MATVNGVEERWLKCQLDRGMFSDEVAVTYPAEGAVLRSVFVPASAVRGKPGEKGKTYAVLPTSQSDLVLVTERDLSEGP